MTDVLWKDSQYEVIKDNLGGSLDDFYARSVTAKIPVEVVGLNPGDLVSIPVSVDGKTVVNYAGKAPRVDPRTDKFSNIQVCVSAESVLEVIFNSEKVGAVGRNRGPHPKKIVYTVR